MNKITKILISAIFCFTVNGGAYAAGIPVLDSALLTNDTTNWIKDTMTELEHFIKQYETEIAQYENMYNQFQYLKNQYTGLIDNVSNIHNLDDILKTYHHMVNMYQRTIDTYNNAATTINNDFATLCGRLESKTLDFSACSEETRAYLESFNKKVEEIKKDNDETVEGSTANSIQKDQEKLEQLHKDITSRPEAQNNKEGQMIQDLRTYSANQSDQLLKLRQQIQSTNNKLDEIQLGFEKERAEKRAIEEKQQRDFQKDLEQLKDLTGFSPE